MKKFTKLMLTGTILFSCLGGVKAQTVFNKVGETDFTSMASLPDWHTQGCTATLEGESPSKHVDITRNEGVTVSYNAQKMVANNISTIVGRAYTVRLRIKGSVNGAIACQFGTWGEGNAEPNYWVPITTEWQNIDVAYTSAKAANSWVIIWVGEYDGTVSIEKVGVYDTTSPLYYIYDYSGKTSFPWYHDNGWGTKPTVDNELTATNSTELSDPSQYMFMVADNIYTETGKDYIIRATIKGSVAGTIKCDFGAWSSSFEKDLSFTNEYSTIECKFSGLSERGDNHIVFKIGKYIGTIYLKKIEIIGNGRTIAVGAAGYSTFSTDKAVDVTGVVTAYKASYDGSKVVLTEVTEIPADAGVIIEAAEGTHIAPTITTAAALTGNDLLVSNGSVTGNGTIFVLANGTHGVGFYKLATGEAVPAGKAYLVIPSSSNDFIGFDDTTGISDIKGKKEEVRDVYFDLQGRRVANPTKGLYIVNGKKVIIK